MVIIPKGVRIALYGIAIGIGGTGAAMGIPLAYPDLPVSVWRPIVWVCIGIFILSTLGLLYEIISPRIIFSKKYLKYLWFLPIIIGIIIIIKKFIHHKQPTMIKATLHATLSPLTMNATGTIGQPPIIGWVILLIMVVIGCVILLLYYRAKKRIIQKKIMIQELYDELDSIAKDKWKNFNYQSIRPAIDLLAEWKDRAKRMLVNLFGQAELNNFKEKMKFVEDKGEYRNPAFGMIDAFYNEKETYLKYLKDLITDLEKNPKLWS